MSPTKADIIIQLQKDILLLQGFKPAGGTETKAGLGIIKHAFPNATFPLGSIHELFCSSSEEASSSCGFVTAVLSSVMKNGGATVWISSSQNIYPPALKSFGIKPEQVIFIHLKKEKDKLWAMEEALKCDSLSSVIGEINEISFTESRRLQLAVEKTKVTGFIVRRNPKNLLTASVTRWRIKPLASEKAGMPGLGFPRWNVELLKVRNGKPGSWQIQWKKGKFEVIKPQLLFTIQEQRKIV